MFDDFTIELYISQSLLHNPFFSTITNPEFQHLNEMRKRSHKVDARRL